MPEIYTKVQNLFDITGVVNTDMVASLGGVEPFRLNYTTYSDGRREVDGTFFIAAAATIPDLDTIINLSDPQLFGLFTGGPTVFTIWTENTAGNQLQVGGAIYRPATKVIAFRASVQVVTLTGTDPFYIRGTLVPDEIANLNLNMFGG